MARGFTGSRGTGGQFGNFSIKKQSGKDAFMKKMRGESDDKLSPEERYQKMVEEKTAAIKKEAMKGARFGVSLPGTDASQDSRQMSKSAQEMIDKMARDKAKKALKKAKRKEVNIQPKLLTGMQGGRIDSDGRIYDSHNKCIAKIDKKTGKVKSSSGTHICNWTGSSYNEYTIARFIEKNNHARGGSIYGTKGHGGATAGGIWGGGGSAPSAPSNTDMWGNKKDDGGGGFWG